VTNVLDRYNALVALQLNDPARLRAATQAAGKVVLARDGRQPTVGNEVLWGVRDCLSGAILLARSLLAATADDRAPLLTAVKEALAVPIVGGIADGQPSVRNAIAQALPDVPHQLCQFPYLQAAATLVSEADRHAKQELKKRLRGVRPIARAGAEQDNPAATLVGGDAVAIRSALSDEGLAPLDGPGLRLQERLSQIQRSMQAMAQKGIASAADQTAPTGRASIGRDRRAVGANPTRRHTGLAGGDGAQHWGGTASRPGAGRLPAGATTDGTGEATRWHAGRCADARPEGDAQLRAGVVPLRYASGHPAHKSWTGAVLRAASSSRAPYDWAETGDARHGVAWPSAPDNECRQPAAALDGR